MKKKIFTLLTILLAAWSLRAQDDTAEKGKFIWKSDFNLQFSSSYFSTYQTSGNNNNVSSIIGKLNFNTNWKKGKHNWDNELKTLFGESRTRIRVEDGVSILLKRATAKNGDLLSFTTKYGYELKKNLNLALLGNLQTQFAPGYADPFASAKNLPNILISKFFAPAITNVGLGLDYKPNANFSLFYSPADYRATIVRIPSLRAAYNVDNTGVRHEFGSFLSMTYSKEIMKNIKYSTKLQLFTNYLKNQKDPSIARPFSVDVQMWQHTLIFQVNKYVNASFSCNLMYDEDTKFNILTGNKKDGTSAGYKAPRTQYFHNFGIGFGYILTNDKK